MFKRFNVTLLAFTLAAFLCTTSLRGTASAQPAPGTGVSDYLNELAKTGKLYTVNIGIIEPGVPPAKKDMPYSKHAAKLSITGGVVRATGSDGVWVVPLDSILFVELAESTITLYLKPMVMSARR